MKKLKPFKKSKQTSSSKSVPMDPLELLKSRKYPDEEEHHLRAFNIYMNGMDREIDEKDCIAEIAEICRVAESTVKGWKAKFGWADRYSEYHSHVMILVAAAHQPELRKNAHAVIASLRATRIDIELRTQQYYQELEEWKVLNDAYLNQPEGAKKKAKKPKLPIPPFKVNSLSDISEYTKMLKTFLGDDDSGKGPNMETFSEDDLRKIIKVDKMQIIQNQGHNKDHQNLLDDDVIDVQATSN